ncbi:MAG TPA: glycosyltransferase family 4 protein [Acidimicrobiia bacterium]|nr:glycosyltransferase family 4 protein [Acidimicrobiia bacterium]
MRIAHLTTVDLSHRLLLLPQLRAIRDEGWEVVAISRPGPSVAALEREGIRHLPLPSSTRGFDLAADARAGRELWRILRREHFDVLHTHNPKPGLYGRVLGRLAGVPVVVNTVHGLYAAPDDRLARRGLVYGLEAIASRCSDFELYQSREDFDLATRLRLVRRGRAALLGNGIDLQRFDPDRVPAAARAAVRREIGARDDDIVVGTVGRLVREKGFPELVEVCRRVGDRAVFVAAGPTDPEKADALDVEDLDAARAAGFRLLGMRDDVDVLYAAMDVFVLASHREGVPRAAMEAAAMGLPIVATDIRGCREVVDDGLNGVLVPPRDVPALTAALETLVASPSRRSAMGRAGRRIALERFDERRVVDLVMATYRSLLAPRGTRRRRPWQG